MNMNKDDKKNKLLLLLFISFFLFMPIVLADDEEEEENKVIKQKIDINFNVGIGNFIKDGNGLVTENRNNKFTVYDECDNTNGHEKAIYINPQKDNEIKMTFYGDNMTNVWLKCWENNAPAPEEGLEDHFDFMTAPGAFGGYTFKANLKEAADKNNGEMIVIDNYQSFDVGDTRWFFLIIVEKYLDSKQGKTVIKYSPCSIPYVLYGDIINNESHDENNMVTECRLDEYPVHTIASYTSLYSKILTRFDDNIYYPGEVDEDTIYYTISPEIETKEKKFGKLIENCDDEDDCTFITRVNGIDFYYISDFTKNYSSVAAKTASLPSYAPKVDNKEETGRFVAIEYFEHDETKDKYEITFREFNLKYLDVILAQGISYFNLRQTLNSIDYKIFNAENTTAFDCGEYDDCFAINTIGGNYATSGRDLKVWPWHFDYSNSFFETDTPETFVKSPVYEVTIQGKADLSPTDSFYKKKPSNYVDKIEKVLKIPSGSVFQGGKIYQCIPYTDMFEESQASNCSGKQGCYYKHLVNGTFFIQAENGYKKVCPKPEKPIEECADIEDKDECGLFRGCYWDDSVNKCKDIYVAVDPCADIRIRRVLKIIGYLLFIAKIAIPIIIIGFGTIDLAKSLISNDNKDLNKQTKRLVWRVVSGIIIFFVPNMVNALFSLGEAFNIVKDGKYQTCRNCFLEPTNEAKCDTSSD